MLKLLLLLVCLSIAPRVSAQAGIPPYPAPAPVQFPSAAAFADYGSWRLQQLDARQRGLTIAGRQDNYLAQRIGAFVVMGAGAASFAGAYMVFYLTSTGEDEHSRSANISGGVLALGAVAVLAGVIWLSVIKRGNPYREEIRDLERESDLWHRDVKRARKEAREMRLSFSGLQLRF